MTLLQPYTDPLPLLGQHKMLAVQMPLGNKIFLHLKSVFSPEKGQDAQMCLNKKKSQSK